VNPIRRPALGEAEVKFTLALTRKIYGSRALSFRRLIASAAFSAGYLLIMFLIITTHILLHCSRANECVSDGFGSSIYFWSWFGPKFCLTSVFAIPFVWLSISITDVFLNQSLRRFSGLKFANLLYLGTIILFVLITKVLTGSLLSEVLADIPDFFPRAGDSYIGLDDLAEALYRTVTHLSIIRHFTLALWNDHIDDFIAHQADISDQVASQISLQFAFAQMLSSGLLWVRVILAFLFVGWWMFGKVVWLIELILSRLFDASNGALSVFSALLTACAGFVHWMYS
jgi:hypothetical protein